MKAQFSFRNSLYVMMALFVSLSVVQAGTIYVDDDHAADFRTIGAAVEAARSGDTIVVAPGTYTSPDSCDIVLAGKVLTIRGIDLHDPAVIAATVIDCYVEEEEDLDLQGIEEIDGHRFITLSPNTGAELTLGGLTIINGSGAFSGGVVLCEQAELKAVNCTFAYNDVQQWGAAVHCQDGYATFEGCSFIGNVSAAMRGGAVYCQDSVASFTDCDFRQNVGNAIRTADSDITLVGCTFEENTGESGGAIYLSIPSNTAEPVDIRLDGCTFISNSSQTSGGAIYIRDAQPQITGCTFTSNIAYEEGGAIYNYSAAPTITSCLFIENTCITRGGAIANYLECHPDILNCTFIGNQAADGGAVTSVRDCDPLVSHCILWGNTATNGSNLYLDQDPFSRRPSEMTVEYSDLERGPASVHAEGGTNLTWGDGNIHANPLFTRPTVGVYRLSADSPCIDAGDRSYIPGADAVDLDGHPRLFGQTVDMGAYEYPGLSPVYRFWSAVKGKHFYTILGAERDKLINEYPGIWHYEDIAYYTFYGPSERNLVPVHRFWSAQLDSHVWTASEEEKDKLLREYADTYEYEGIAFYAFPEGAQPLGTAPTYRFWSDELAHHFYTISEEEKDKLITNYSKTWTYEGVVWYVYPEAYQLQAATYAFRGGAEQASYTITVSAYVDGREVEIDAPEIRLTPDATQMQMGIAFADQTATLDTLSVQTLMTDHTATLYPGGTPIPFTISVQAAFECLSQQGPFYTDPSTGVFADYVDASQRLEARDASFSYTGRVAFSDHEVNINATAEALTLELASYGIFESLNLLPDNINARMPLTFQWHRPYTRDLLVETYVKGKLVQFYVTYMYVGTQGLWVGQAVE